MRAGLLSAPGTLELVDVPTPVPGPGEVVIRVGAAAICGSDLSAYRGVHTRIRPPTILGHEFAGTVSALGQGVDDIAIGTRVTAEPNFACGQCRGCRRGFPNVCASYRVVGEDVSLPGACAEFVRVQARGVHTLPASISFAEGAVVQPMAIAHRAVDRAQVEPDQTVLILGAGPIGLAAMRLAGRRGARTIVADVLPYRLTIAARLGADVVVDARSEGHRTEILAATGGDGADVTLEIAGGDQLQTWEDALALTARQGRIVIVGSFKRDEAPLPIVSFKFRELDIVGSQGHPDTFRPMLDRIADGTLPAAELITHRLPLERLAEAFTLLSERADGVLKVVIEP